MQWFRWYHGTCADPKLGSIARKCGTTKERVIATWAMILEAASDADERGTLAIDADAIADCLNCPTEDIQAIIDEMAARGMLGGGIVTKWQERQPSRDDSAARQRAKRQRDAGVTRSPRDSDANVPRQDTETDTDISEASASAPADLKTVIFDQGLDWVAKRVQKPPGSLRSLFGRWCRDYGDASTAEALMSAQREGAVDPISWITKTLEARNGKRTSSYGNQLASAFASDDTSP